MTFENDFVHVEMFCIKKDTKIEPAWTIGDFYFISFLSGRNKQDGELLVKLAHQQRVPKRAKRLQISWQARESGCKNVTLRLASLYLHSVQDETSFFACWITLHDAAALPNNFIRNSGSFKF